MALSRRLSRAIKTTQQINELLIKHRLRMNHLAGVYTITNSEGVKELSTLDIRAVSSFLTEKSELTAKNTFDNIESM